MKVPATMNEATGRNGILSNLADIFRSNIREYGMLIALIAVMIFFQIRTDGILMKPVNITNLVLQNSYVIIMALGMLLIIVSGWIDLSVGSVAAFVGAIDGDMMIKWGWNWALTIGICLLIGGLIGAWQGYWVAYVKIPAFIVTLAGMLIFRGLTLVMVRGEAIGPFPVQFGRMSTGFIPDFFQMEAFHLTTIVIGVIISILLIWFVRNAYAATKGNMITRTFGMPL